MTDQPTTPAQMAVKPLLDAMAQIKNWSFDGWQASAFEGAAISTNGREAIAAILNAVASGAIIPAPAPAEQEPVAYADPEQIASNKRWLDVTKLANARFNTPLYAHLAPVPAVPDDDRPAMQPSTYALIELLSGGFIEHHRCGGCGDPVGYEMHPEFVAVVFNSGCGCSGGRSYRPVDHREWIDFVTSRAALTQPTGDTA